MADYPRTLGDTRGRSVTRFNTLDVSDAGSV